MTEKNTKVLMEADFSFHLGKLPVCDDITQSQALELVNTLSESTVDKSSCATYIIAEYNTGHTIDTAFPNFSHHDDQLELNIVLKSMKCCNKRKVRNERTDTQTCLENIKSGKCKDKNVCQTIGAILFPELYAKKTEKQK